MPTAVVKRRCPYHTSYTSYHSCTAVYTNYYILQPTIICRPGGRVLVRTKRHGLKLLTYLCVRSHKHTYRGSSTVLSQRVFMECSLDGLVVESIWRTKYMIWETDRCGLTNQQRHEIWTWSHILFVLPGNRSSLRAAAVLHASRTYCKGRVNGGTAVWILPVRLSSWRAQKDYSSNDKLCTWYSTTALARGTAVVVEVNHARLQQAVADRSIRSDIVQQEYY